MKGSFEAQVREFLSLPKGSNRWDYEVEGMASLHVGRWKDLWVKVPEQEEWQETIEGYTLAYQLGYLDHLHVDGCRIITSHVEGREVSRGDIPLVDKLFHRMKKDKFYLYDWHKGNILVASNQAKVVDWGLWGKEEGWAEECFLDFRESLEHS